MALDEPAGPEFPFLTWRNLDGSAFQPLPDAAQGAQTPENLPVYAHATIVRPLLIATLFAAVAAQPAAARNPSREARPPEPPATMLAQVVTPTGDIRFERFADGTVIVVERASGGAGRLESLASTARAKGVHLCTAQVFDLLTGTPAPPEIARRCAKDAPTLDREMTALRAEAKVFRIFDDFRDRPLLCNGLGNDNTQFREIECSAMESNLHNSTFYDSDSMLWCANTLRTTTDRSLSGALDDEGEAASIAAVSCGGNTRFRFYKRDSVGSSWVLYRDYTLQAAEYISLYTYDNDQFGDSDFRFRLDSTGSGHRSTGYFIDD
jgi:hypothetical protein